MKKRIFLLLAMILAAITAAAYALDPGYASVDGIVLYLKWFGSGSGSEAQYVSEHCPFRIPEEGEVLMVQCTRAGTAITNEEVDTVLGNTRLYNKATGRFLDPIAMNWYRGSSYFDLFFYDDAEFREDHYSMFCGDEEFFFKKGGYPDLLRKPLSTEGELPTMPPEGSFLEDAASDAYQLAESLAGEIDGGQLEILEGEPQYGDKIAVFVFNGDGTAWKTTLIERDGISDLIPAGRRAAGWDDADTLILIRKKTESVGQYGFYGEALRVYTMVTVVDKNQHAMYRTYQAFVSEPPKSIEVYSIGQGGAEGTYEYVKAIEQICGQPEP